MIEIYTGKTGTGKSLRLAEVTINLIERNKKWFEKTGQKRIVLSNLKYSVRFEHENSGWFDYWSEPEQLIKFNDCDIIWDEIATHLDSTQWQNVPLDLKRFLQQHRKRGIDIYGTSQAFGQVDISMRRLVDNLWICFKWFGNRNPSPTKPAIKRIWGLIVLRSVEPDKFDAEKISYNGWSYLIPTRELVDIYDTRQEIKMGKYPPLKHQIRECIDDNCDFVRITHS